MRMSRPWRWRSEEELEACPQGVGGARRLSGPDRDRVVKLVMRPIEEAFDILRHVPGQTDIGLVDTICIAIRAGEAVGEDLVADHQVIVPSVDFPGSQAE